MNMKSVLNKKSVAALSLAVAVGMPMISFAQPAPITQNNVVSGTMDIQFNTRMPQNKKSDGSVNAGVQDIYALDLKVLTDYGFTQTVTRQPKVGTWGSMLNITDEQRAGFDYKIGLTYKTKAIGSMVGFLSVDENGNYNLEDTKRPLRIDVQAGKKPFVSNFKGNIQGKSIEGSSDLSSRISKKIKVLGTQNGKKVAKEVEVEAFDASIVLAAGANPGAFPETVVSGSLNYDQETANYYPRLTFKYTVGGKEVVDVVEGNIRWNDAEARYEFNVTYGTPANTASADDVADFFDDSAPAADAAASDDDFFAADTSIPALTGNIVYEDSGNDGNDAPLRSKATYALNANAITQAQVMNFMKFWLLAIGPTNDE